MNEAAENEVIRSKEANNCEYLTRGIQSFLHNSVINEIPCLHYIRDIDTMSLIIFFSVNTLNYCAKLNSFAALKLG